MRKLQNQDNKYKANANKIDKLPNNKRKKIIIIITIFILLLIIGISYAAYDYSFVVKERNVYRFQSG